MGEAATAYHLQRCPTVGVLRVTAKYAQGPAPPALALGGCQLRQQQQQQFGPAAGSASCYWCCSDMFHWVRG
jgi:hypothetical protein